MYRRLNHTVEKKGVLIPANDSAYKHIKNLNTDHYLSVYMYNEEQHKKFYEEIEEHKFGKDYKTINGAQKINDVVCDQVFLDFDYSEKAGTTLENAKEDTKEAIKRLNGLGISDDYIQLYFSGNKGFAIVVNSAECIKPKEHKNVARNIAGDLKTWDTKIYNASRIFRVPNTKHPESGLFKIALGLEELDLPVEAIKELAKTNYEPEDFDWPKFNIPKDLYKEPKKEERKKKERGNYDTLDAGVCTLDFNKKPKGLSNWKFALASGYFPPGSRNSALMILGATFRGLNYDKTQTYYALKAAADLQSDRFDQDKYSKEEIWTNIIEQVFSTGWSGGTYAEDNFPDEIVDYLEDLGIERTKAEENSLVISVDEGFDSFANYAENINEYTMKFGIDSLDEKLKVRKGHLIFMLAAPSVGKTSIAITMLNNMSKQGVGCYFGSYDMYKDNVYQKLIQRHTRLSEDDLYDIFINKDTERIKEFRQILKDEYENVSFCFKVGQTVGDLKKSVQREEEKRGRPIELVVVDYLELVLTNASDPTAASAEAAQGLRELANEGRVVFGLLQPNKFGSTVDEAITTYNAAKGSSSIAQAGTAMLTGHRPGMSSINNNEDDHFFGINCVKNRNGPLFSIDFGWEGETQTIYDLDDAGKKELKELRERKKLASMGDEL